MSRNKFSKTNLILYASGLLPVVWLALLTAPFLKGGLKAIFLEFPNAISNPFQITFCEDSLKTVLLFLLIYAMGIGIYVATAKNYRRGEEHGSAQWGDAETLRKKYEDKNTAENKLLTQHTAIGLNGRKHLRNLNVLVCGGSGSGKTRFYAKPNIMQANTSYVILDPKGTQYGILNVERHV